MCCVLQLAVGRFVSTELMVDTAGCHTAPHSHIVCFSAPCSDTMPPGCQSYVHQVCVLFVNLIPKEGCRHNDMLQKEFEAIHMPLQKYECAINKVRT